MQDKRAEKEAKAAAGNEGKETEVEAGREMATESAEASPTQPCQITTVCFQGVLLR
jgi:hypothetical protein